MTTILISVAIIAILLAFTLGRWSKSIDINRQLHDIEVEGVAVAGIDDVCRVISRLDNQKQGLFTELNQLRNSNNAYQKNIEQLKDDYYKVMSQLRDKRDELSKIQDNLTEAKKRFDNLMAKVYKLIEEINTECGETISIGAKYAKAMDKSTTRSIYAHMLHNKTTLLTAGICAIEKNGKVSYPAGSRSLGNAQSKENAECFAELTASLNLKAGESKIIGVISNYAALKACAKTYSSINHGVTKIMGISSALMIYLTNNKNMLNEVK